MINDMINSVGLINFLIFCVFGVLFGFITILLISLGSLKIKLKVLNKNLYNLCFDLEDFIDSFIESSKK